MKIIIPDYYPLFRCTADKCRHSCCVGWEIDVDPAARERYRRTPGPFGERLNAAIHDGPEGASFRLDEHERCPLLNPSGLCDLITALGEEALCQICADHPRWRSFLHDRTEMGLGLCCEAAARLILTREEPARLTLLSDDGEFSPPDPDEENLLALRDALVAAMQDRSQPIEERLRATEALGGLAIPPLDWPDIYRRLERLDPAWDVALDTLSGPSAPPQGLDTAFEQFAVYLLFRHIPGAAEDGDLPGRAAFCVLSTRLLMALCAARPGCSMEDCIDLARMYSAEIEYSQENLTALLDALWDE